MARSVYSNLRNYIADVDVSPEGEHGYYLPCFRTPEACHVHAGIGALFLITCRRRPAVHHTPEGRRLYPHTDPVVLGLVNERSMALYTYDIRGATRYMSVSPQMVFIWLTKPLPQEYFWARNDTEAQVIAALRGSR